MNIARVYFQTGRLGKLRNQIPKQLKFILVFPHMWGCFCLFLCLFLHFSVILCFFSPSIFYKLLSLGAYASLSCFVLLFHSLFLFVSLSVSFCLWWFSSFFVSLSLCDFLKFYVMRHIPPIHCTPVAPYFCFFRSLLYSDVSLSLMR